LETAAAPPPNTSNCGLLKQPDKQKIAWPSGGGGDSLKMLFCSLSLKIGSGLQPMPQKARRHPEQLRLNRAHFRAELFPTKLQ
jgi:hypothetical protein